MRINDEGHILVTPREFQERAFENRWKLINQVLLQGTPVAFPTHESYCEFLEYFADCMRVHPRNIVIKGSGKLGFSIAPRPEKVWMECGPDSDLDLAIVDPYYFQMIDEEVRHWERNPENRGRIFQNPRFHREYQNRVQQKGRYYCFRYFDLPAIPFVEQHNAHLGAAPVESCCGTALPLTAFVYKDWWGICSRYEFDLYQLCRDLQRDSDPLPAGGETPRPRVETIE
jgi:hypothetical protein